MSVQRYNIGDKIKATQAHHAGLWLDKYLRKQTPRNRDGETGEEERRTLVDEVAAIPTPSLYNDFFQRWQAALTSAHVKTQSARLLDCRLAIGLGAESVIETGITLHRTYGVPYIPGSALKGLAAHYARCRLDDVWHPQGDAYKILFGYAEKTEAAAGYVTFYDALYIPAGIPDDTASPLKPDVLTIHHQAYYNQPDSNAAPADWDSPTIVPWLSATGTYLIAIGGVSGAETWVDAAFTILNMALVEMGVGAKTSSGYGRMVMDAVTLPAEMQHLIRTPEITAGESYEAAKRRLLAETPSPGRERGIVIKLAKAHYGYIRRRNGAELFVHQSQFRQTGNQLQINQIVEYSVGPGQNKGQSQANDVIVLREAD